MRNKGTIYVGFAHLNVPQKFEIASKLANPTRLVANRRLNPTYDFSYRPTNRIPPILELNPKLKTKDVSDFKAQMAQKHLEHILRVQKINPDLGRGFWGGGPMSPGMMHRGMMGPGGKGNRGAYNCPFGGPGGGYGKGQQMMRGGGYGMGPDGSGRDCPRQYNKRQGSQAG